MKKPANIEKIKTILIVVLFIMTVLLLYFFWRNDSTSVLSFPKDFISSAVKSELPAASALIRPNTITVNFGSEGDRAVIPSSMYAGETGIWNQVLEEFRNFSKSSSILAKDITKEQYKIIMMNPSLEADLNYSIPFSQFCKQYNIDQPQSYNLIGNIQRIAYSDGDKQSLFIYDGTEDKYYRLTADSGRDKDNNVISPGDFSSLIQSQKGRGFAPYYSIGSIFGSENGVLMPLTAETNLQQIAYSQEIDVADQDQMKTFAESFFGVNFDFVRKITETKGNTIYMYGYGQKLLTINKNGASEYKAELNSDSSGEQNMFESLDLALKFIGEHGGWNGKEELTPYLKKVEAVDRDKKKGFRFFFGFEIDGSRISFASGEPLVAEVIGKQVTYYKRDMVKCNPEELKQASENQYQEVSTPPTNVIAWNLDYMSQVLIHEKEPEKESDIDGIDTIDANEEIGSEGLVEDLTSKISLVEIGYVKPGNESEFAGKLVPCWIVRISDIVFYFDLDTADPLGYAVKVKI